MIALVVDHKKRVWVLHLVPAETLYMVYRSIYTWASAV